MISTSQTAPKLVVVSYSGDLISAQVIDNLSRARTASELVFMACVISYEASRLIAKKPIYEALAEIFLGDLRAGQKESQKG